MQGFYYWFFWFVLVLLFFASVNKDEPKPAPRRQQGLPTMLLAAGLVATGVVGVSVVFQVIAKQLAQG